MANKATAENIAADIRPPEYRKAVQLMRHDIKKKKDRISGINGEIADVWGKIEGHKVNKVAGKVFMKLDSLEDDERVDVMRSLNGLIDAAGWPEAPVDLADSAEGKVVKMRVGGAGGGGAAGGGDDDTGDDDGAPAKGALANLASARRHLGGGGPDALDEGKPLH